MSEIEIMRGDAFSIPVEVTVDDETVDVEDVETVEFSLGHHLRKTYPEDATWSAAEQLFKVPVTQEETFALRPGEIRMVVRVKFTGGMVLGAIPAGTITVKDASSGRVL